LSSLFLKQVLFVHPDVEEYPAATVEEGGGGGDEGGKSQTFFFFLFITLKPRFE